MSHGVRPSDAGDYLLVPSSMASALKLEFLDVAQSFRAGEVAPQGGGVDFFRNVDNDFGFLELPPGAFEVWKTFSLW
jgi:hypothetical protein